MPAAEILLVALIATVGEPAWLRGLSWGMTAAQAEAALGERAVRLDAPLVYGGATAPLIVPRAELGGVAFRAILQIETATGRLRQVVLENRRPAAGAFEAVRAALEAALGAPEGAREGRVSRGARWASPATTVHVCEFDDRRIAMLRHDPNTEIDPLADRLKRRRNEARTLPHRLIVRYHPAVDAALHGDCAGG